MGVLQHLSVLALHQLIEKARQAIGIEGAENLSGAVSGFLLDHFTDHSQLLTLALLNANKRPWTALEVSLLGDRWWERLNLCLTRGEHRAFRQEVQSLLNAGCRPGAVSDSGVFRASCLRELRRARKSGFLTNRRLAANELAKRAEALARFSDPQELLDAGWAAISERGNELCEWGYPNLASLLALDSQEEVPLLAAAARYFFDPEVQTNSRLFQRLIHPLFDAAEAALFAADGGVVVALVRERLRRS